MEVEKKSDKPEVREYGGPTKIRKFTRDAEQNRQVLLNRLLMNASEGESIVDRAVALLEEKLRKGDLNAAKYILSVAAGLERKSRMKAAEKKVKGGGPKTEEKKHVALVIEFPKKGMFDQKTGS